MTISNEIYGIKIYIKEGDLPFEIKSSYAFESGDLEEVINKMNEQIIREFFYKKEKEK